jgi:hypothetical protein
LPSAVMAKVAITSGRRFRVIVRKTPNSDESRAGAQRPTPNVQLFELNFRR